MSSIKRVVSGSIASWVKIVVTFLSQFLLVPIYLSYWETEVYGVWITIQAVLSFLLILDVGHHNYIENECLRLGMPKKHKITLIMWSGGLLSFFLGLVLVTIFTILVFFTDVLLLFDFKDINPILLKEATIVLLILLTVNWLTNGVGGVFTRTLYTFNHYARLSWYGVIHSISTTVPPIIAVVCNQGLLVTGIVSALSLVIYYIPYYVQIRKLLQSSEINYVTPSFKVGWSNFFLSLVLSAQSLLLNARQYGVRLILAPLAGATALVAFTTMRTGANLALKGLGTITGPLMPELMRFLNEKHQEKFEGAIITVWSVLVFLMAPGIVVLQLIMPSFFKVWTRNKVEFDPLLFALLSLTVLIYALAQPAIAIIKGNNRLKTQVSIAGITALVVVGGMFILVPLFGVLGAGIALVLGELVDTLLYKVAAKKWLINNGLQWPIHISNIAALSVLVSAITLGLLIMAPNFQLIILIIACVFFSIVSIKFYKNFPDLIKQRMKQITKNRLK